MLQNLLSARFKANADSHVYSIISYCYLPYPLGLTESLVSIQTCTQIITRE